MAAGPGADGPQRNRIAAVFSGGRQGSGYLLSPRLVLTAAHVIGDGLDIRIAVPGGPGDVRCRVVWQPHEIEREIDVALIEAPVDLVPPTGLVQLGEVDSLSPIRDCQAIGFPYVQRGGPEGKSLDSEQVTGTLKPGSGMLKRQYVLDSDHAPPSARQDGGSAWAGMSGAAVFCGALLMAVVCGDPRGWPHSRLITVPVAELVRHRGFMGALDAAGCAYTFITRPVDPDAAFTSRYAAYIAKRHSTLTIFGIDLSDRSRAVWPLDAAYLSLEVTEPDRGAPGSPLPGGGGSVRAEQTFAGRERVLLRGLAGSGKTTLVQWLAVSAAGQDQDAGDHHLRDRVPFVLPLRTLIRHGELPLPADFLRSANVPLTAPDGWTERILQAGRGLLLVDGLDEIGERERDRVRDWLRDLLIAFPGNLWLVTSRPSAVSDAWLAGEAFAELALSPMGRDDVGAFITRWHDAARATDADAEETARTDGYQRSLLDAVRTQQDLARLATNPLMCGLICALHRDRRGYLPHSRKQLYDAAMSMLLGRRDLERDIDVRLTEEPQIQLLQKLAYWMIRNGQVEMDQTDAEELIAAALPAMPAVAAMGDASQVFQHLLLRSGLLREPAEGTVDFIHRTFQDYLGAKAAVEERDFAFLVRNAHDDQWEDVLRMAVAHARPDERARLLNQLVARGDRTKSHRSRLHLLAMACLEQAVELDAVVRTAVEERAAALIPPRSDEGADALAAVGPVVLELLPGPAGLSVQEAAAVVRTAGKLGTDAAMAFISRFTQDERSQVQFSIVEAWDHFPVDAYAEQVLKYSLLNSWVTIDSAAKLRALPSLAHARLLWCVGALPPEELLPPSRTVHLQRLNIKDNPLLDNLGRVSAAPELELLGIANCPGITDLEDLRDNTSLEYLDLWNFTRPLDLRVLESLESLRSLGLATHVEWADFRDAPALEQLTRLWLIRNADVRSLRGIEKWRSLGWVSIDCPDEVSCLSALAGLPDLRKLVLRDVRHHITEALVTMPAVATLQLVDPSPVVDLASLVRLLPGLVDLRFLYATAPATTTLDLTALRGVEGIRLTVENAARVIGAELFPQDRLHITPHRRD
ncbi:NACHT domain-containing protein [Streptomyces sp. So13.3]|uniref:NACHT domain-containing protein n=1 Tax=Streptomyces TaxID=1883 RepID=UPI001861687D|nr:MULTISPECIES: NACHT domain-containing protein [Streptomyces]MCZ4101123.1 NACHT domain-containing protein [Streptomyces sp. H39-C1]QNA74629.1 NACHT domain-containing protein [Streptomyces sp. So13.3]